MRFRLTFAALGLALIVGCQGSSEGTNAPANNGATNTPANAPANNTAANNEPAANNTAATTASFADVQAILTKNCLPCHGDTNPKEELALTSYEGLMKGSEHGAVIVAGKPEESMLVWAIRGQHDKKKMPPGKELSAEEIATIEAWIRDGAKS